MQNNSLAKLALILAGMTVIVFLVLDLLTSGGNAVAQLYRYLMVGGAIYGLLSPRPAFYVLVALTAYLDFSKRLMIFDSTISKIDLYYVLGIAPAILCGIAAHTFYSMLISGHETRPGLVKLAVVTVGFAGLLGFLGVVGATSRFQALGDAVNATVYLLLIPIIPSMFRTPNDLRKLLYSVLIIYTPAVIYMLVHWFRGSFLNMNPPIFDWELDYVKSGLTIEIRQLAERKFRPFGTFNSAANASMIFAALFGMTCSALWRKPCLENPDGRGNGVLRWLLACLLVVAMFATYSRTGWVFAALLLFIPTLFKSRFSTLGAYCSIALATVTLVIAAPSLLKHKTLNEVSATLFSSSSRSDSMAQVTNISTMNDRLEGFYALTRNPKIWTPLGFKQAYGNAEAVRNSISIHDAVTMALIKYGYIPLALGAIMLVVFLKKMHAYVLAEREPLARSMAATCLAIGLVLSLGVVVNSAQLITYPVNFWVWFMFSCVVALMFWRTERDMEPTQEPEEHSTVLRLPRVQRRSAAHVPIAGRQRQAMD